MDVNNIAEDMIKKKLKSVAKLYMPYIIGAVACLFFLFIIIALILGVVSSGSAFFKNFQDITSCTSIDCDAITSLSGDEQTFAKALFEANSQLKIEGIVNPDIALFTATILIINNYDSSFNYTKLTVDQIRDLIKSNYIAVSTINCVEDTMSDDTTPNPDSGNQASYYNNGIMPVSNIYGKIAYEIDDTTGEPISPEEQNPLEKKIPCTTGEKCTCPEGYTKESESTTYEQNNDQYNAYLKSTFFNSVLSPSVTQSLDETAKNALFDKMTDDIYKLRSELLQQGGGVSAELPFFILPVSPNGCTVTSPYAYRHDPDTGKIVMHRAIDVAMSSSSNNPILAVADGIVTVAHNSVKGVDYSAGCGNYVYIDHIIDGVTYQTRYCHMVYNSITVNVGDTVFKGQQIGIMGTTGYSTGVHLHFAVMADGQFVDPTSLFSGCFSIRNQQ
jgi:hypothetical protein